MDDSRFDALATALVRSRRTLLGTAVAATGAAVGVTGAIGKKKKKKKCKAPTTKCGKKSCCQPGEVCANGQCAPATTIPTPLTAIGCTGPKSFSVTSLTRYSQIFKASGTGLIATASFELASIAADTAIGVEIRTTQNGAPTNTVLGTAIVFGLPASASTVTPTAVFAPKVAVEQGQTYALVIIDVANKDFILNGQNVGKCPWPFFIDNNPNPNSLIFTVSP